MWSIGPRWRLLVALAVFSYVLWFRTHGISDAFWLRGDQVRDWALALGPFADLPRSGVPSTAGGTTLGPAYYWFLWLVARIAHPLIGSLPHAGGFGVGFLQSAADAVLLLALFRRFRSPLVAILIVVAAGDLRLRRDAEFYDLESARRHGLRQDRNRSRPLESRRHHRSGRARQCCELDRRAVSHDRLHRRRSGDRVADRSPGVGTRLESSRSPSRYHHDTRSAPGGALPDEPTRRDDDTEPHHQQSRRRC